MGCCCRFNYSADLLVLLGEGLSKRLIGAVNVNLFHFNVAGACMDVKQRPAITNFALYVVVRHGALRSVRMIYP